MKKLVRDQDPDMLWPARDKALEEEKKCLGDQTVELCWIMCAPPKIDRAEVILFRKQMKCFHVAKQIVSPTCQRQKSISQGLLLFVEMVDKQNLWNQWDVDCSIAKGELLQWLQSSNIHRDLHGEKPPMTRFPNGKTVMPRQEAREVVRDVLEAIALKDTPMDLKGPDFGGWNGLELEWS